MDMLGVSIFVGIWYWICKTDIGYAITHAIRQPLFAALPIGFLMGDVTQAIIIGAAVQILYIGLVAAGSNLPADDCLAGLIAIPIAVKSGLTPELAIAIAVPVGLMGVFVDQLRKTVNVIFVHMADKYAQQGNIKQIQLCAVVYPTILSFFMRFPIPFFATLYGANAVDSFMQGVPQWLIHGFSVAGGLLPALGFALTMFVIGKKNLLPWFFIGYFMIQFSGIPVIGAAIFGLCAVLLINAYSKREVL
ncbi:putative membrane protein [Propionispora sp. 2/2-37]|uniref:PTS mannose/fructose/sorbose/N-acetylgalactosamine transporter subunit IIC n=1 Tax=Propionispora sp. 2/2-37 TaxID=1677858 RepID=UPI0006C2C9B2|nr:PTS sugar transporter subunit IIC [Propionispora sp. 2/2-37]CUH95213.1 putative membrane protein [Propionispora sp. 2/2-37]